MRHKIAAPLTVAVATMMLLMGASAVFANTSEPSAPLNNEGAEDPSQFAEYASKAMAWFTYLKAQITNQLGTSFAKNTAVIMYNSQHLKAGVTGFLAANDFGQLVGKTILNTTVIKKQATGVLEGSIADPALPDFSEMTSSIMTSLMHIQSEVVEDLASL